jgi:ribose transport system ATP-binding protein
LTPCARDFWCEVSMSEQTTNILEFVSVCKSFSGTRVLKDVSCSLRRGHVLGLLGENGAGKSTLMNILGGVLPHESGEMRLNGEVYKPESPRDASEKGIAFIHQELNLFVNLSISENLFITSFPGKRPLGVPTLDRRRMREQAAELLKAVGLDVSPDTPVELLPQGERQLVEIAKALSIDAKVIIFDEPTTSLTKRETERLFGLIERLREDGISMIYISHILEDVYRLCDDLVVLRDGAVVGSGTPETMEVRETICLMVGREIEQLYPEREHRVGEEVLEVRSLSQRGVVHDINFSLHEGETVGVFGMMGSGRTELARILFGVDPFERGDIFYKGERVSHLSPSSSIRRGMAFLTEDRRDEGLLMDKSIATNASVVALPTFTSRLLHFVNAKAVREKVRRIVQTLHIASRDPMEQPVRTLSGGNQQKVVIGKWLMNEPKVFIADEPTRGIDVGAKYEVYKTINDLAEEGTAVLLISSELEELLGMCDRILVMRAGEILSVMERSAFDRERILESALAGGIG